MPKVHNSVPRRLGTAAKAPTEAPLSRLAAVVGGAPPNVRPDVPDDYFSRGVLGVQLALDDLVRATTMDEIVACAPAAASRIGLAVSVLESRPGRLAGTDCHRSMIPTSQNDWWTSASRIPGD